MKKYRYFILALVCCMLLPAPVQVEAAELYGTVGYWLGDTTLNHLNPWLFLDYKTNDVVSYSGSSDETINSGIIEYGSYKAIYEGSSNFSLSMQTTPGTYLDGYLCYDIKVSLASSLGETRTHHYILPSMQPMDFGTYNVSIITRERSSTSCVFRVRVEFYGHKCNDYGLYIPLSVGFTSAVISSGSYSSSDVITYTMETTADETGALFEYTDLRDVPSIAGDFANQNQEIIDGIDENTSAVNSIGSNIVSSVNDGASYIGSQIQYYTNLLEQSLVSSLTSIRTTLSNFFTPYFDNITNAFKKALSDTQATDNAVLESAMDDYQAAEQEVFNPAMESLTEFDFESHNISSLGTGFVASISFVSSCLANMYELTPFSRVFEVIATLGLASICIGLSRLWFGKKGR